MSNIRLIITVSDGLIEDVVHDSQDELDIIIIDRDIDGADENHVVDIAQFGSQPDRVLISRWVISNVDAQIDLYHYIDWIFDKYEDLVVEEENGTT